jgi:hypothetical protein
MMGERVLVNGIVQIRAVIRSAAKYKINYVTFDYDCDWPSSGPVWQRVASLAAPPGDSVGNLDFVVALDTTTAVTARDQPVRAADMCQIRGIVEYADAHRTKVDKYTSFRRR